MKRWTPALALLLGAACKGEPAAPPPPPAAPPGPVAIERLPGPSVPLAPPVELDPGQRSRRRMDLDQLEAAMRAASGGIGWTEVRNGVEVSLWQELGATLGKPDFIQATDEDLEPSAMFQKFLDDAARAVCDRLMTVDPARSERSFFLLAEPGDALGRAPEKVEQNLRALLLRFHGKKLAPGAPELEPWRWLMQGAEHVGAAPPLVWRTVCVGLYTHPDFYTY